MKETNDEIHAYTKGHGMTSMLARNLRVAALLAALAAVPAHGKDCKGVSFSDHTYRGAGSRHHRFARTRVACRALE